MNSYKDNSPQSSTITPYDLINKFKDNSPAGTAAHPQANLDSIDKRWLVKDATTGFPHSMELEFKHEDTSPPKV